jgi:transposase
MRVTTVFRRMLGVSRMSVSGVSIEEKGVVVAVAPGNRLPRCGGCGKRAPGYDRVSVRDWRHLGIGSTRIWLRYAPRRVECHACGVRVEKVPWAASGSLFTLAFEEMVAYLAQGTDQTKVTRLMGIAWQTVGSIVERVVDRCLDPERLKGLRTIGVDEFSYRKRHRYLTLVVDHEKKRVVWTGKGRSAEVLKGFFDLLGPEGRASIGTVTVDLAGSYTKAVTEAVPQATICYDRFHVQRLASAAVDQVRRAEVNQAEDADAGRDLKSSRFALLRNPWNLTKKDGEKLSVIQETNQRLYRAYLLKEALRDALDCPEPRGAMGKIREWLAWASRSKLKPFVRVARTVRSHLSGVAAYLLSRLTNGFTEGINNMIRMIARRAFGFHSAEALSSMIFLNCGGIQLAPALPSPTPV